ncbi:GMC family oxidoreductase [Streptosporangiaceae bacterium NEAU-GS5]|nr:GMC family oxidoreductase [Streptosporangiaceae bacterium NEAU-GS5]
MGAITRRHALKITAVGTGAAVASGLMGRERALAAYGTAVPSLQGKTAIVIGSGFSGAVTAYRLAQAGMQVTVIERGRRWTVTPQGGTFCTISNPDWRAAWFSDHPHLGLAPTLTTIEKGAGLVAKHFGDGINVLSGTAVGGGSLVIGMFMPQPRKSEWDTVYPPQLPYDLFDGVYWPRARQNLGVTPLPDDILAAPQYKGARAWLQYVAEFGGTPVKIPFAVDWDRVRAELAGTAPACHIIGEGPHGSNSGAKNSVDKNYLRWAEETGRCTVLSLHVVTAIREVSGQDRFEVVAKNIHERSGETLATRTLACDYLFMAAGSLYTTSLLVTARHDGTLTRLNDQAGKGWGNNGDFLMSRLSLRKDVGYAQGGPGNVKFFDDANPYCRAAMAWEAAPVPTWVPKTTAHLITTMTPERGEIRYDAASGAGKVYWPYGLMETKGEKAGRDLATRFWWATEGSKGYLFNGLPDYDEGTGPGFGFAGTWHPLGGMVHGKATDFDGRVLGYPNLYCVDGSVLPGSACLANPSLTITANAERITDAFVAAHV